MALSLAQGSYERGFNMALYNGNNTYLTASGNDATALAAGPTIDNQDGTVTALTSTLAVTASGGSNPTSQLGFQGSDDGANWYYLMSNATTPAPIQSAATPTTGAAPGSPVVVGLSTAAFNRNGGFPPFLRAVNQQAGTSPTWNGTVAVAAKKQQLATVS